MSESPLPFRGGAGGGGCQTLRRLTFHALTRPTPTPPLKGRGSKIAALLFLLTFPLPALAQEHVARLGQKIYVDGPRVRPLAVLEDSRCPMEARCAWAGRVRLKVRIYGGRGSFVRVIESGVPTQVFDGQLTLESVMPPRHTGKQTPRRAYRFHFSFAGGL